MAHCATSSVVCRSPISAFSATLSVVALRFRRSDPNPERSAACTRWGGKVSSGAVEALMDESMMDASIISVKHPRWPAPADGPYPARPRSRGVLAGEGGEARSLDGYSQPVVGADVHPVSGVTVLLAMQPRNVW